MRRHKPRQINLRISEGLRRKLEAAAKKRQISTNLLMRQLIEDGLDSKAGQSKFIESIVKGVVERLGLPAPPAGAGKAGVVDQSFVFIVPSKSARG